MILVGRACCSESLSKHEARDELSFGWNDLSAQILDEEALVLEGPSDIQVESGGVILFFEKVVHLLVVNFKIVTFDFKAFGGVQFFRNSIDFVNCFENHT